MKFLKNFSLARFFILIVTIGVLTLFSLFSAFGKDEGTLGDNVFLNFMAGAFYVFRFPTHVLFWKFLTHNSGWGLFLFGLLLNVVFYASVIEGTICRIKPLRQLDAPRR